MFTRMNACGTTTMAIELLHVQNFCFCYKIGNAKKKFHSYRFYASGPVLSGKPTTFRCYNSSKIGVNSICILGWDLPTHSVQITTLSWRNRILGQIGYLKIYWPQTNFRRLIETHIISIHYLSYYVLDWKRIDNQNLVSSLWINWKIHLNNWCHSNALNNLVKTIHYSKLYLRESIVFSCKGISSWIKTSGSPLALPFLTHSNFDTCQELYHHN